MYIITSLSGSSDSRKSNCATMTFATSLSISEPRKMMRSLSNRENRSQPRPVLSHVDRDLVGGQRAQRGETARAVGIDVPGDQPGDQVLLAHPQRLRGAVELVDRLGGQAHEQRPFVRRLLRHIRKISRD